MAEPEKNLDKLREEQAKDDGDILAELDKESKEFDKVASINLVILSDRANGTSRTPKSTAS